MKVHEIDARTNEDFMDGFNTGPAVDSRTNRGRSFRIKEGWIRSAICLSQEQQRQLASMVVSPHRTFAAGNFLARRNVVPAVWPMINRMQNQSLVLRFDREIRLIENCACDRQPRLPVSCGRGS